MKSDLLGNWGFIDSNLPLQLFLIWMIANSNWHSLEPSLWLTLRINALLCFPASEAYWWGSRTPLEHFTVILSEYFKAWKSGAGTTRGRKWWHFGIKWLGMITEGGQMIYSRIAQEHTTWSLWNFTAVQGCQWSRWYKNHFETLGTMPKSCYLYLTSQT